jgi:hypothetical protein
VFQVNKFGVHRIRVYWTDGVYSNVAESSLMRIN